MNAHSTEVLAKKNKRAPKPLLWLHSAQKEGKKIKNIACDCYKNGDPDNCSHFEFTNEFLTDRKSIKLLVKC